VFRARLSQALSVPVAAVLAADGASARFRPVNPGRRSVLERMHLPERGARLKMSRSQAEPGDARIGVFLVDDHEVVRQGVRVLLEAEPDITVVGEAGTASAALARIPAARPDVAVLDVRLPDGNGVSVCRDLGSRMPEVACLMLTSFDDEEALFGAIMAGAAGYVTKQIRGADLAGAIRVVASGQSLLDPRVVSRVMRWMREQAERPDPLAGLSDRERQILALIGAGLTNATELYAKLGINRRAQAVAVAARLVPADREERPGRGTAGRRHPPQAR